MKKKWLRILLSAMIIGTLAGCGNAAKKEDASTEYTQAESDTAAEGSTTEAGTASASDSDTDTFVFTDSAGREVTLPKELKKIAPSGQIAQLVLYTAAPDLLCGLAKEFTPDAKLYIDEKYWSLPVFGQFYGKNASLNMEALIAESPDVIVDIGEAKENIAEDMDALSEQLGIPTVFIEATLPTMESAYRKLGELTGNTRQTDQLSRYSKDLMEMSSEIAASIPEEDKKTVYFALGDSGLNTNAKGSIHSDVIEQAGALNVATLEASSQGGVTEVSLEQIFTWNPDFIVADSQDIYKHITTDSAWMDLKAVKSGNVYKVPAIPYDFLNNPPSVNRLIGIYWLGNLVYPELYTADVRQEIVKFYELFYHLELPEQELDEILKNAYK